MLEGTRKIYEDSANLYVENWKNINKNDLVRMAIDTKGKSCYDGYISAIMLRYWGKMTSYYHKCKLVATPEDVHTWMTQAVLYAVNKHPWTNEKSSIFGDKNGPDKVINRVFESKRLTFYQQLNRYNRKINSAILSIEALSEEMFDTYTPMCEDEHTFMVDEVVVNFFNVKDYFVAFLIDAVVNERFKIDCNNKKLVTHLQSLEKHCDIFAGRYDLDINRVKRASTYVTRLNRKNTKRKIKESLITLKRLMNREVI